MLPRSDPNQLLLGEDRGGGEGKGTFKGSKTEVHVWVWRWLQGLTGNRRPERRFMEVLKKQKVGVTRKQKTEHEHHCKDLLNFITLWHVFGGQGGCLPVYKVWLLLACCRTASSTVLFSVCLKSFQSLLQSLPGKENFGKSSLSTALASLCDQRSRERLL